MDGVEPNELAEIDSSLVVQKLRSDQALLIVDVRTAAEFRNGHIPSSRLLPFDQLSARVWEIEPHRCELIVVVSQCGYRAKTAADVLLRSGFDEVFVLAGGIARWQELGYAVEDTSMPPPPMTIAAAAAKTAAMAATWSGEDSVASKR